MSRVEHVDLEVGELITDLRALGAQAPFVLTKSLNRAALEGKTEMVTAIRQDTALQAKYINREIKLDKAMKTRPTATVIVGADRIPLIAFSARGPQPSRGKGRGVSYRLPGGRERISEAFIATVRSEHQRKAGFEGHKGVFKRKGALGRKVQGPRGYIGAGGAAVKGAGRLPIKELYGPSMARVFLKFMPLFRRVSGESLVKNLAHEISWRNRPTQDFGVVRDAAGQAALF